ncbi:MAG: hypothetical protein ACK56N_15360, partial [Betaproteobacteria bacterium]
GFTLNWTLVKEANAPQYAGIATGVVNTGIFLGAGILQPLVGWAVAVVSRPKPSRLPNSRRCSVVFIVGPDVRRRRRRRTTAAAASM